MKTINRFHQIKLSDFFAFIFFSTVLLETHKINIQFLFSIKVKYSGKSFIYYLYEDSFFIEFAKIISDIKNWGV